MIYDMWLLWFWSWVQMVNRTTRFTERPVAEVIDFEAEKRRRQAA